MSAADLDTAIATAGPADSDLLAGDRALFEVDGIDSRPRHLSPSSASLFAQCPRRWRYRYVEHVIEPPGEPALVGTFVHRVLEVLFAEAPEHRTIERAKVVAREVWPETARHPDYQALGLDDAGARRFRWYGWLAVEAVFDMMGLETPDQVQVHATEQRVTATIGGVPFLGIVDRLDRAPDGLVVTDYKSGKAPSTRFREDKLDQVLLYAAAITEAEGEAPVRARLVYLGSTVVQTDATPQRVGEAVDRLRATWDALQVAAESDAFEPKPGPLCGWCPHVATCAEGRAEVRRRDDEGRMRADAPALALIAS
jgi:putative RecB family exonuclease